jgi:hypothetical protein
MRRKPWDPAAGETAETIFRATEAELSEHARTAIVDDEPIVAAGAFWPNGATRETMEHGTVGGHKLGAVFGPNVGVVLALAEAASGRGAAPEKYDMAKPLIVAVTSTRIHIVEPAIVGTPARVAQCFERATTVAHVKRWGLNRILFLDDDVAGRHFRLLASIAPYLARSGPEKAVLAEITAAA